MQHQRQVGYVFAGSEPTLMERMIGPKRPFYKAGPVMRLEKIPADIFARFIDSRFTRSGIRAEPGFAAAVLELAGHLPYDVQRLAHEVWDDARAEGWRKVGLDHLHADAAPPARRAGDRLRGRAGSGSRWSQRAVLRARRARGRRASCSRPTCATGTGSAAPRRCRRRSRALRAQDVVTRDGSRYAVVDSLMREWIARRTF